MKDPLRFNNNFETLVKVFDKSKLDLGIIDAYWEALYELTDSDAEKAISLTIQKWKPGYGRTFPSPSEIRGFLKEFKSNVFAKKQLHVSGQMGNKKKSKHASKILSILNQYINGDITANEFKRSTKQILDKE